MEGDSVFSTVLTKEEWHSIPNEVAEKINSFVQEKFQEFITCRALYETNRFNSEQSQAEVKRQYEAVLAEKESLQLRFDVASQSLNSFEEQVTVLTAELTKLQTQCNKLESESAEYRHQRNLAVDERDEHLMLLQRRNTEIERMQSELTTLSKQLEAAVNTKCEALAQADEVASMKITLEYREKRIEQERALYTSQVESLTKDLNERTEELLNMRRDNTSRCIMLETKLAEKSQELVVVSEQVKSLSGLNANLVARNEELAQKLLNQRDMDAKMNESYVFEIEAKTKMANTYKTIYEESQQHAEELKEALTEVQQLLQTATDKYGELETRYKENELSHEEIVTKKNDCIALLKKELETANELLESTKQDKLQRDIESFSPTAASVSRFLKPGMTLTEIYSQYVAVSEKLANKDEECARLNNYITCIVQEIEEKGPLIKRLRQDYSNTLDANDALKSSNDSLMNEIEQLREANSECKRLGGVTARENQRLKKEVADLSRQVCHLLQEVEHSRVGSTSSNSTDMDLCDSISSADIITKKLVTFNDICELQATNQKLLALVRDLSEKQEEVESYDPAAIANMKQKLDDLRKNQAEMLEERDQHNKMMNTLRNQRDWYKNLYEKAVKASGEDVPMHLERPYTQTEPSSDKNPEPERNSDKIRELEREIENYKKKIDALKEEHATYRKEKAENDKILTEQLDSVRAEAKQLTTLNCKLGSQMEVNEEKFKVLQNNCEIYMKQIAALEKKNKIVSDSLLKYEHNATYLKDETLACQTKLSRAEVMLSNLQKENALLKSAESRLLRETELLKRDSYQQNLLQSNIELIKATLERSDAEGKLRLESRLDESARECAALRRRLQEEQDHYREMAEQLKKRTENAEARMGEEKQLADQLRKDLEETRGELMSKSAQIEDLTKRLKLNLLAIPENNADGRKLQEMQNKLSDAQSEIESLTSKLNTVKEAAEQYCSVAEASEAQLKVALDQQKVLEAQIEQHNTTIKELQEKCSELQGELSISMDDQDMANATKTRSQQMQEELNIRTMDLTTARKQLEATREDHKSLLEQLKAVENKYAREVMLHSVDLQALTSLKEQLDVAQSEIKSALSAKEQAEQALTERLISWEEQERLIEKEKNSLEQRFQDMDTQNTLLLDQLQALNSQLNILQAEHTPNQSLSESFNRSVNEDDAKSSAQLLKIVKFLRQEKDIAVSKADIMEAETMRLKTQFEMVTTQLEEAKAALEQERQKSEVDSVSSSKHAEVLRRLDTLNALTDSNRSLRQERDNLLEQVKEFRVKAEQMEGELAPLQERNKELMLKADQMQNEAISSRADVVRWRQRAQMLLDKTNRTSPEDWKKLQTERENLAKQLTIERSTTTKLNDDINNLRQSKTKLEEQLKNLRTQNGAMTEELTQMREAITSLQQQLTEVTANVEEAKESNTRLLEQTKALSDENNTKDGLLNELKGNLGQIRKIAKKYKIQSEDYAKEIETLKKQEQNQQSEINTTAERQEQILQEQRTELEDRVVQIEATHKETIDQLNQQVSSSTEQIDSLKKEIENLKQVSYEKEERFKNLFKNAKERIVTLTEQNNNLKDELSKSERGAGASGSSEQTSEESASKNAELLEKIEALQKEKEDVLMETQQEKEKLLADIESLTQRINQLQRQLGLQQGSKPSTSSGPSEKSTSEPPTANIKPMAGHSTNTQTQSVPIQPWRSGGEPPLASIRPMSAQLRTVAVLPTSQSPSAVMVPPQQQVHTTGSSTIESLSSSPTSSHTDYVPATSSASPAMLGPRQVAVPPTQSSEDDETSMQMQTTPQQQAVALVLPRIEPPSSGPTQEQGTSSSSSNTVTTTQAGLKRQREADDSGQGDDTKQTQSQSKRSRVAATVSDSGLLDVEYQVPTSSQRDHDDDNVIVVESDEEGGADEGEGADDDQDDPDTEGYDIEGMEQDNYGDGDEDDVEDEEEGGNEVEVIEDSSEVPNQSERQEGGEEESGEQAQSEAISSGTADGTGRSVPTTPLQASPQESAGADEHGSNQSTQSDADITVTDLTEPSGEGSSGECMGPPVIAGTSSEETQQSEQTDEMLEGDDEVSSEGEKPLAAEDGGEEEGREAEASPSTNTRSRNMRNLPSARRSLRQSIPRGGNMPRSGPTPIVWGDMRNAPHRQHQQGMDWNGFNDRGRGGGGPSNFSPRQVSRRSRGRMQRPFGRF